VAELISCDGVIFVVMIMLIEQLLCSVLAAL
jgi:hypothetical protein